MTHWQWRHTVICILRLVPINSCSIHAQPNFRTIHNAECRYLISATNCHFVGNTLGNGYVLDIQIAILSKFLNYLQYISLQDNYNRMLQEQKPKKSPRKKSKPIAMTRPHKRNKRKKRACAGAQPQPPTVLPPPPAPNIKQMPVQSQPQSIQPQAHITRSLDSMFDDAAILGPESIQIASKIPASIMANHFLSDNSTIFQYAQTADDLASLQQQELFTVCENSSAYESSEDTGVGGLSESELMGASDGIGKLKSRMCLFILFRHKCSYIHNSIHRNSIGRHTIIGRAWFNKRAQSIARRRFQRIIRG